LTNTGARLVRAAHHHLDWQRPKLAAIDHCPEVTPV
jgi:hypothetical protein